jgi:alpha-glucosidase
MNTPHRLMQNGVALLLVLCSALAAAAEPSVAVPTDAFFQLLDERDRDIARRFYAKYIDVAGMPVVAHADVADEALVRVHEIVTHMLAGRPDVTAALVKNRMYLIIIGKDQVYTDMPEYRRSPNPEYQNERVRGTGGRPTSFGEENVLSLPLDRYDDESIAVHEFCHTIDGTLRSLDAGWSERKNAAFRNARDKGLYQDVYAGSNAGEYWAETCQAYFDCQRVNNWNHGPIGTREQLKAYDPVGYELVRTTFALSPDQDWRYSWLRPLPNVGPPPAKLKIDPFYTKFTWAREFTVLGREASDEALLKANDTIRKLFAYRHDLLKALIADGVKLVILGRKERLADLPEYAALQEIKGFDALSRTLEYSPDSKLLVVGEENVLADPNQPGVGDQHLIRLLAKAVFQVTGSRPVDPNWENRGRNVQQYELRVRRLDERFGTQVKEIFTKATAASKWRGTTAIHDPAAYWAAGVLAYFDALGQDDAPGDAPHPIATRELLRDYDPELFALVHESMAYHGKVDWRFVPAGR